MRRGKEAGRALGGWRRRAPVPAERPVDTARPPVADVERRPSAVELEGHDGSLPSPVDGTEAEGQGEGDTSSSR